jgi:signal transduction histidine kinase
MLLEEYMGQLSPEQKDFVQRAYDSNERQLSTINDLLQVAQLDVDTVVLHREVCDAVKFVRASLHEQRRLAAARGQQILLHTQVAIDARVWIDTLRLRLALDNIIDNARKYSSDNTVVVITVTAADKHVTIAVADQGVGIDQKDFPKLFKRFSRIQNPRSIMVGGAGIGLYLAKRIIDAHQGAITVRAALGKFRG